MRLLILALSIAAAGCSMAGGMKGVDVPERGVRPAVRLVVESRYYFRPFAAVEGDFGAKVAPNGAVERPARSYQGPAAFERKLRGALGRCFVLSESAEDTMLVQVTKTETEPSAGEIVLSSLTLLTFPTTHNHDYEVQARFRGRRLETERSVDDYMTWWGLIPGFLTRSAHSDVLTDAALEVAAWGCAHDVGGGARPEI